MTDHKRRKMNYTLDAFKRATQDLQSISNGVANVASEQDVRKGLRLRVVAGRRLEKQSPLLTNKKVTSIMSLVSAKAIQETDDGKKTKNTDDWREKLSQLVNEVADAGETIVYFYDESTND